MFEYTLNTATVLLFGEPHSSMDKGERNAVRDNFGHAAFECEIRVRLADAAFVYNPPSFSKACKRVPVGEEIVAQWYPFIIDMWKEMKDFELVRDQLLPVLVAGRDSTSVLMC